MAPSVIPMGLDEVVEGLQYEVEGAGLFGESIPFKNFFAGCFERLAVLALYGFPFVIVREFCRERGETHLFAAVGKLVHGNLHALAVSADDDGLAKVEPVLLEALYMDILSLMETDVYGMEFFGPEPVRDLAVAVAYHVPAEVVCHRHEGETRALVAFVTFVVVHEVNAVHEVGTLSDEVDGIAEVDFLARFRAAFDFRLL